MSQSPRVHFTMFSAKHSDDSSNESSSDSPHGHTTAPDKNAHKRIGRSISLTPDPSLYWPPWGPTPGPDPRGKAKARNRMGHLNKVLKSKGNFSKKKISYKWVTAQECISQCFQRSMKKTLAMNQVRIHLMGTQLHQTRRHIKELAVQSVSQKVTLL